MPASLASVRCRVYRGVRSPSSLAPSLAGCCGQAYYLPTSVAVAGLAKTAFCFGASLSLFVALVWHKVAPPALPAAPPAPARGAEAGE